MKDLERDVDEWFIAYLEERDPRFEWVAITKTDQDAPGRHDGEKTSGVRGEPAPGSSRAS